ncbi:MAG TPA: TonB-dependent receptor plug domain-containing protein [Gemmatimonadaceae bacterium]|nr:TonB-dependent receptor plug domain-containing protein [Gemmatimonadaceae bacterium]
MSISVRFYSALTLLVGATVSAQEPIRPAGADVVVIIPDSLPDVPRTLTELLAARAPGVTVQRASGSIGGGSWVSLRDAAAIRGEDPLIIVDGVRRARHVLAEAEIDDGSSWAMPDYTRRAPSALDDIPVEDVERIEILRGAAAASAYGPDARFGVIAITTRAPGTRPRLEASLGGGYASSSLDFERAVVGVTADGFPCPVAYNGRGCTAVGSSNYTPLLDNPLLSGGAQRSARVAIDQRLGSLAGTLALSHERVQGVLPADGRDRTSGTARVSMPVGLVRLGYAGQWTARGVAQPMEYRYGVDPYFAGAMYYPRDCTRATPCGADSLSHGYRGNRGWIAESGPRHRRMRTSHAVTARLQPWDAVQLESRIAGDWFGQDIRWADPESRRQGDYILERSRHASARFLSAEQEVRAEYGSNANRLVSLAVIRLERGQAEMSVYQGGRNLVTGASGASTKQLTVDFRRSHAILQQRFATARFDAGAGVTIVKLADWHTSMEDPTFGNPSIDAAFSILRGPTLSLRARAAAGRSRSFEQDPIFLSILTPFPTGTLPPYLPDRVSEVEGGFDLSSPLVRASVTTYRSVSRSERALMNLSTPSTGFTNWGITRAVRGLELSARSDLTLPTALRLALDGMVAFEKDEVSGGEPPVRLLSSFGVSEGESFGFWIASEPRWTDANGDGLVDYQELTWPGATRAGRSRPSRLAALRGDLAIGQRWHLGAHLDYRGGHLVPDAVERVRCWANVCAAQHDPSATTDAQIRAYSASLTMMSRGYLRPGDAVRVRELSLSSEQPATARILGAAALRVTVAIKNAGFIWSRSGVWDPETFAPGPVELSNIQDGLQAPIPREVVLRASLSY